MLTITTSTQPGAPYTSQYTLNGKPISYQEARKLSRTMGTLSIESSPLGRIVTFTRS